jgi:beta-glucosidase
VTFYKNVNDLPDFEDYSMDNRTYRYFTGTPLYPFGFGLSYTTFKYSNLQISPAKTGSNRIVTVTFTNTGKMAGDEVVQLYLAHPNAGFKTPIRTLKGFKRITLKTGEAKIVSFHLGQRELSEIDANGNTISMTGNIQFSVGGGQPSAALIEKQQVVEKVVKIGK